MTLQSNFATHISNDYGNVQQPSKVGALLLGTPIAVLATGDSVTTATPLDIKPSYIQVANADDTKGIKIASAFIEGAILLIENQSTSSDLNVYPNNINPVTGVSDTIEGLTDPYVLTARTRVLLIASTSTNWIVLSSYTAPVGP